MCDMRATIRNLQKLCRPNNATPGEIVFAAWQCSHEIGGGPSDLLSTIPPETSFALKQAALHVLASMLPDAIGISFGTALTEQFDASPFFVPRDFISGLVSPPDSNNSRSE